MFAKYVLFIAIAVLSGHSLVHIWEGLSFWVAYPSLRGLGWLVPALSLGAIVSLSLCWSIKDYKAWRSLGEGGLPSNIFGWLIVTALRPMAGDVLDQSGFKKAIGTEQDQVHLSTLPVRVGPRPKVAEHAVPHRQITQRPSPEIMQELSDMFDQIVSNNPVKLHYKLSRYEKHNNAIWLQDVEGGNPSAGLQGEVGHFHPSDGSMHTILSPSDAKAIIDKGWGELHSLARFKRLLPSETYVMLYAPTTSSHIATIKQIMEAAVRYALPINENTINL